MDMDTVLGIVRHLLTTAGGALVANGTITGSQEQDIIGGIVALVGIGWSIYQKRQQAKKVQDALMMPPPKTGVQS